MIASGTYADTSSPSLSLPDPLIATWVTLSVASSSSDAASTTFPASPSPRCDHGMINLSGRSQRKNEEVAFPGSTGSGSTPPIDPYASQLLMHGGHEDSDYSDSWLLRLVSADSAEWKFIPDPTKDYVAAAAAAGPDATSTAIYSEIVSDSSPARFGFGLELVPNGLAGAAASETGLTAIMFGGYNNDQYLGDVMSLHLASGRTRTLVPSVAAASDSAPFARGYVEWSPLPKGSGSGQSGSIDSSKDSGRFYLMGGLGASSGERYSPSDMDWNDEWIFDVKTETWTRLDVSSCLLNITSCSDAALLSKFVLDFSTAANVSSLLDFTSKIRPGDFASRVDAMQSFVNTFKKFQNSSTASSFGFNLKNVQNACTTTCGKYASDTNRLQPPPHEGARQVVSGNNLYLFGGYSCSANGVMTKGGDDCYSNDMWIMSLLTYEWRVISSPDSSSEWFAYWPTRRAYHAMAALTSKGLILVEGGAYQDQSGSYYYYNDVTAFDVKLEKFVPLKIYGVPPKVHWSAAVAAASLGALSSATSTSDPDSMILFGGCQGALYYDQLLALRVGMAIEAKNCYAYGGGIEAASAGDVVTFYIQTREVTSNSAGQVVFGKNATYGTGLAGSFSAQLVSIDSSSSASGSSSSSNGLSLVQTKVSEIGGGLYRISYSASQGSEFQLFVYYETTQIPHSPYHVTLSPHPTYSEALSEAAGLGTSMAEKGENAGVDLIIKDKFGNSYQDNRFLLSQQQSQLNITIGISRTVPPLVPEASSTTLEQTTYASYFSPIPTQLTNLNNGQYSAVYAVPTDTDQDFYLRVAIDNIDVVGSPFRVEALDSIRISPGLIIALWFLSLFSVSLCILSAIFVHHFRMHPSVRSSSPNFLHILIFGSILSSLSVIFLTYEKSDYGCQGFHSLLSIGLVTSLTALLAKSHRIMRIFNASKLRIHADLSDFNLFMPVISIILLMVLVNLLWIGLNPTHAITLPSSDVKYAAVLSFHTCSGKSGTAWLAGVIGFTGVILLFGVYVAVSTGHVPQQFNESRVIAAAVYNIFFCSIIVVPLMFFLGNTSNFLNGKIVLEALPILWCSLFNIFAILGPKMILIFQQRKMLAAEEDAGANEVGANIVIQDHNMMSGPPGINGSLQPPQSMYFGNSRNGSRNGSRNNSRRPSLNGTNNYLSSYHSSGSRRPSNAGLPTAVATAPAASHVNSSLSSSGATASSAGGGSVGASSAADANHQQPSTAAQTQTRRASGRRTPLPSFVIAQRERESRENSRNSAPAPVATPTLVSTLDTTAVASSTLSPNAIEAPRHDEPLSIVSISSDTSKLLSPSGLHPTPSSSVSLHHPHSLPAFHPSLFPIFSVENLDPTSQQPAQSNFLEQPQTSSTSNEPTNESITNASAAANVEEQAPEVTSAVSTTPGEIHLASEIVDSNSAVASAVAQCEAIVVAVSEDTAVTSKEAVLLLPAPAASSTAGNAQPLSPSIGLVSASAATVTPVSARRKVRLHTRSSKSSSTT